MRSSVAHQLDREPGEVRRLLASHRLAVHRQRVARNHARVFRRRHAATGRAANHVRRVPGPAVHAVQVLAPDAVAAGRRKAQAAEAGRIARLRNQSDANATSLHQRHGVVELHGAAAAGDAAKAQPRRRSSLAANAGGQR